jgi:hypothetical protein
LVKSPKFQQLDKSSEPTIGNNIAYPTGLTPSSKNYINLLYQEVAINVLSLKLQC